MNRCMPVWLSKHLLVDYVIRWTEWLLGRPHTAHSWQFMKNLGVTGISTVIVGGLGMTTTVILGRILGPTEFGQYSLVISMAQFTVIFLTWGLHTALTHALPRSPSVSATVQSIVPLFLGTMSMGIIGYLTVMPWLVGKLHITTIVAQMALGLAMIYAIRYVADALLRGQGLFRNSAWLDITSAIVGFSLCILLLSRGWRTGVWFVSIPLVIAGLYALGGLWQSRLVLGWRITAESWNLLQYGFWSVVVGVTQLILLQIDKVLINYYLGSAALGIYTAYISGALLITALVFTITNYVLLPESSMIADITPVLQMLRSRQWYLILGMSGIACLTSTLFITLLGRAYPWNWQWIGLVSVYAGVYFYSNVLITIAFSRGKQVVQKLLYLTGTAVGIYAVSLYLLAPHFGLTAFFLALILAYGFLIIVVGYLLRYNTRMSYDTSL